MLRLYQIQNNGLLLFRFKGFSPTYLGPTPIDDLHISYLRIVVELYFTFATILLRIVELLYDLMDNQYDLIKALIHNEHIYYKSNCIH